MVSPSPSKTDATPTKSQTGVSTSGQSPGAKRRVHNERQPLAERMRPTDFDDLFVALQMIRDA